MTELEYQNLVEITNKHAHSYYCLDNPTIEDFEYDLLFKTLQEWELANPNKIDPNSPTQRVGHPVSSKLKAIPHSRKLYSLDNLFNLEDLTKWLESLNIWPITISGEPKYDGSAISAVYDTTTGKLKYALTRGDGLIGEDVTHNFITAHGAKVKLNPLDQVSEFRGEIVMPISVFNKLNRQLELSKSKPLANPRNAAAGTLRLLDPKVAVTRHLHFIPYETYYTDGTLMFPGNTLFKLTLNNSKDIPQLFELIEHQQAVLSTFNYATDGVVLKIREPELREKLGYTDRVPRWAMAYKYPAGETFSELLDVVFQVGRTGLITPVAKIKPVQLSGVMVSSVTLHNVDELARLNLHYGDKVKVKRQGEVIPKLFKVRDDTVDPTKLVMFPMECPCCNGKLTVENILIYCRNSQCSAQTLNKLIHFVSRGAMDIDGLADKLLAKMMEADLVVDPSDLYKLTKEDLMTLDRMGVVLAQNILQAIERSKNTSLDKFIFALGIPEVGVTTAKSLAKHFNNLLTIMQAGVNDFILVPDVGHITGASIFNYFQDPDNKTLVLKLVEECGINLESVNSSVGKFTGHTYVITGSFDNYAREQIQEKIEQLGGKCSFSVSSKTTAVIVGKDAGSKLNKAIDLNIPILNMDWVTNIFNI
jgi:DNA ligase (NAD+)